MEPIRVLQCFTILNRGGAETMIMNYYRNIDRTKVQFDFLVHRDEIGAYEQEIKQLGGRIYRLPAIHPVNYFRYQKAVRQFLLEHPEYKIIHGHFSELGCWLYKEAKRLGVPNIIVHAHNYSVGFDSKTMFRFYWKHKMRRYVTHYFSCSNKASEWLFGKKSICKTILMNNAIDIERFTFNKDLSLSMKKQLGIEDKLVIGHVGRFDVQKNHIFLLDIFSEILKKNKDSVLVLVGTGILENQILQKIEELGIRESVILLGVRNDVNLIMQSFDVFVFPSLFEGLGVVLIEAQAAGLSCYTSEGYVPQEAKVTDLLKYISLSKSATEWADIIFDKYSNNEIIRKDTYNELVTAGYSVKDNVKWLEEFYLYECGR